MQPRPSEQRRLPATTGYWPGLAIALLGFAAGLAWGLTAYGNYQERIEAFPRLTDPGLATVRIAAPGERVRHYEGSAAPTLDTLDITVTGPSGEAIAVRPYTDDLR